MENQLKEIKTVKSKRSFIMSRSQLQRIWQSVNWQRVIDIFGLQIDTRRRIKSNEMWIKSPFTGEETASLHLNIKENIFKDFSSGKGGGVLNLCQELLLWQGQRLNCYEVAQWMVDEGISIISGHETGSGELNKIRDEKGKKELAAEPERNKPIRVDLRGWLQPDHPELKRRRISKTTSRYLGCGYLPNRSIGRKQSPLNGRLVFQVRGITEGGSGLKPVILTHVGRALTAEKEKMEGKYWGFPFLKGHEIYNQDKLLLDIMARGQVEEFGLILVEGFFDVAALVESGCLNVGALMGAQISDNQVARLKFINSHLRIPRIKLFLDRDKAGIAGTKKAVLRLKENGFRVNTFDWNQAFYRPSASPVKIPSTIKDAGDMSAGQLQWLRKHGKI